MAEELQVPFLAEVPLIQSIREAGDVGRPAVLQGNTPAAAAFDHLCTAFQNRLAALETQPKPVTA